MLREKIRLSSVTVSGFFLGLIVQFKRIIDQIFQAGEGSEEHAKEPVSSVGSPSLQSDDTSSCEVMKG